MSDRHARLAGVELYFDDLPAATDFYTRVLGLTVTESQPAHHRRRLGNGGPRYGTRKATR